MTPDERKQALLSLLDKVKAGEIALPESGRFVNLHCHTFFSYNTYGYSPTKFAWLARKAGLAVVGTTDFDVLDALDEFREACRLLGLKGCSGLETRVYVPEFSTRVINSPGEPGISYHMGVGFPSAKVPASQRKFLTGLKQTAQQRNRDLMQRVNRHLSPIELDYESRRADPDAGGQRHRAAHVPGLRPQGPGPFRRDIGRAGGSSGRRSSAPMPGSSACPRGGTCSTRSAPRR